VTENNVENIFLRRSHNIDISIHFVKKSKKGTKKFQVFPRRTL